MVAIFHFSLPIHPKNFPPWTSSSNPTKVFFTCECLCILSGPQNLIQFMKTLIQKCSTCTPSVDKDPSLSHPPRKRYIYIASSRTFMKGKTCPDRFICTIIIHIIIATSFVNVHFNAKSLGVLTNMDEEGKKLPQCSMVVPVCQLI